MLAAIVTLQGLDNLCRAFRTTWIPIAGQLLGILTSRQNGAYDFHARGAGDIAQHIRQAHIHLMQGFLHLLNMGGTTVQQVAAVAHQRPDGPNLFRRMKGATQQSVAVHLLNALTVQHVCLGWGRKAKWTKPESEPWTHG